MHRLWLVLLALAAFAVVPRRASAQEVETPVAFDSAGWVMVLTPRSAARLTLGPPAWRITGDYREARLFRLTDDRYVIVVTRPSGALERYPITRDEREILRARTSTLPPGFDEQLAGAAAGLRRATRNSEFVRNQTVIGLLFYAPAFAAAITDDPAGATAAYLLAAGGSFFAASELTRQVEISDAQNAYATHMATRGTLIGMGLAHTLGGNRNWIGSGGFVAGLGGTAMGIWLGRNRTVGEAAATGFGADVLALMTVIGHVYLRSDSVWTENGETQSRRRDYPTRGEAGTLVGAGLVGYQLGALYPRLVSYNVTAGDVRSLWVTGGIGMLGASTLIAGGGTSDELKATAVIAGFAVGAVLGDRVNVSRLDLTLGEANTLLLGSAAGGLMGAGLYVLADRERDNDAMARGLATAGAIAGFWLTERFVEPVGDAGSSFSNLEINPAGAAMAAMKMRGTFPIISLRF
ncbi:MAG TPA: hypothetical protein VMM18_16580 [Gemmatimonadaceae bacterium]|nr:hypothetical protein [Gemmatimonadaceae bacterium]